MYGLDVSVSLVHVLLRAVFGSDPCTFWPQVGGGSQIVLMFLYVIWNNFYYKVLANKSLVVMDDEPKDKSWMKYHLMGWQV